MTIEPLPQDGVAADQMQGHWVLARLGKTVLRPGGLELSRKMLASLKIEPADSVVEFAPGMGATAKLTLKKNPWSYTAVDRENAIVRRMNRLLKGSHHTCIQGLAQQSGLLAESATKVYSEAMLTMQTDAQKRKILQEAHRLLRCGGLYGMHEVGIVDSADEDEIKTIQSDLTHGIKVGARPLSISRWKALLEDAGFVIIAEHQTPFHLLEPHRIFADEGVLGALKIFRNMLRYPRERKAVLGMRRVFRQLDSRICAIALVARKIER